MRSTIVSLAILLLVTTAGNLVAANYSLVTSRSALTGTGYDSLDWDDLGPAGTAVSNPFSISSTDGVSVQVREFGGLFYKWNQTTDPFSTWGGNFAPGDGVLYTGTSNPGGGSGPITIDFGATNIRAGGAQINGNFASNSTSTFIARITALDENDGILASFTEAGVGNPNADNSAIFIGIESDAADIEKLVFSLDFNSQFTVGDFAINRLDFVVPEPATIVLSVIGVLAFAARESLRQRKRRN